MQNQADANTKLQEQVLELTRQLAREDLSTPCSSGPARLVLHLHHIHSGLTAVAPVYAPAPVGNGAQQLLAPCVPPSWCSVCSRLSLTCAAVEREARVASDDARRSASASDGHKPSNR